MLRTTNEPVSLCTPNGGVLTLEPTSGISAGQCDKSAMKQGEGLQK
jgi:hypothetical protein